MKEWLSYDPATGEIRWNKQPRRRGWGEPGDIAGSINMYGYRVIMLFGRSYRAHHLAWLYVYGVLPKQIDHINGERADNRIANLRECTSTENNHNQRKAARHNKIGVLGVSARKNGRFAAQIKVARKLIHLGSFGSAEEAHQAYVTAKRKYHESGTL